MKKDRKVTDDAAEMNEFFSGKTIKSVESVEDLLVISIEGDQVMIIASPFTVALGVKNGTEKA